MAQDDSGDFVDAVVKEVNGHVDNTHWGLIPIADVPEDTNVLPSMWSMRRKRNLVTNEIKPTVPSTAASPESASVPNVPDISFKGRHITPTKINNVQVFESIFEDDAFQSTFETRHDRVLELQDKMRHPNAFLVEMQGDTI